MLVGQIRMSVCNKHVMTRVAECEYATCHFAGLGVMHEP